MKSKLTVLLQGALCAALVVVLVRCGAGGVSEGGPEDTGKDVPEELVSGDVTPEVLQDISGCPQGMEVCETCSEDSD